MSRCSGDPRGVTDVAERKAVEVALAFGLGAAAMFVLFALRAGWNAMMTTDSVYYVESAWHFAAGLGLTRGENVGALAPVTHWPPLYAVLLGGGTMLKFTAESFALYLNIVSLGVVTGATLYLIWALTRSLLGAILATLFLTVPLEILLFYIRALSDPLFTALSLAAMLLLVAYVRRPSNAYLVGMAGFLAFALLCRYAGAGILLGILIVLWIQSPRRWRDTAVVGLIAVLPLALWMAQNAIHGASAADRMIAVHPPTLEMLGGTLQNLSDLLCPWDGVGTWLAVGVCLLALVAAWRFVAWRRSIAGPIITAYLIFMLASMTFFDSGLALDNRALMPIYPLCAAGLVGLALRLRKPFAVAAVVAVAILIVLNVAWACDKMRGVRLGRMTDRYSVWMRSPILADVRRLPNNALVITPAPAIIHYVTGRECEFWTQRMPDKEGRVDPEGAPNRELLARMRAEAEIRPVFYLEANLVWSRAYGLRVAEIARECPLTLYQAEVDGSLYSAGEARLVPPRKTVDQNAFGRRLWHEGRGD